VVPYIKDKGLTQFLIKLFADCQKPENIIISTKYIPDPQVVDATPSNQQLLGNYIKKKLDLPNAQPLGISYCSGIFENQNLRGIYPDLNKDLFLERDDCFPHGSLIIGKKVRDGVCHFLIRNTLGTHCNYSWPCMENARGEATGIWVSENALINNLMAITNLTDPEMLCTAHALGMQDTFKAMFSNEIFSNQQFPVIFKRLLFTIKFDDESNTPKFLFIRNKTNSTYELKPDQEEGKNDILYSRSDIIPDIGRVNVICKKYSNKMIPLPYNL
jgi:hypothetical protein